MNRFETVRSYWFSFLLAFILLAGLTSSVFLSQQQQEIRQRAATIEVSPVPSSGQSPTPTPPPGCSYKQVTCITAPCNPVLICTSATPTNKPQAPTNTPTPTSVPKKTPTPTPPVGCKYEPLPCLVAPCPVRLVCQTPTPTPTNIPKATPTIPSSPTPKPPTATIIPTKIVLKCDFNGDKKSDIVDFNIWREEFTTRLKTKMSDCSRDQKIDIVDFNMWRNEFLKL